VTEGHAALKKHMPLISSGTSEARKQTVVRQTNIHLLSGFLNGGAGDGVMKCYINKAYICFLLLQVICSEADV